jgi:hypothetical protein
MGEDVIGVWPSDQQVDFVSHVSGISPSETFLKRERPLHPELSLIATAPKRRRDLLLEKVNYVAFG